jgi:putative Mg2+ transporter-C (MgtC) family protein
VIRRDGFNVRGLNTAATLWCSAAVGVLAASGHLAFAVIGTITVLAVHLLGRPLGRLIDHDNPAGEAEDLRPCQLHITCKPKSEPRIRALLVQDTGPSEVIFLRGIDTTRADDGSGTRLTAHLLAGRDAAPHLEQLVSRLSLEPGIHGVRMWPPSCPSCGAPSPALRLSSCPWWRPSTGTQSRAGLSCSPRRTGRSWPRARAGPA